MEIVPIKIVHGEAKAWKTLSDMDPKDVCQRSGATYSPDDNSFILRSFGMDFKISIPEQAITCSDAESCLFLKKLRDFFMMTALWYLTSAKDIPETGRFVRPVDLKGGHRFSAGTHVLPMDMIAKRFAKNTDGFIGQGLRFGGAETSGYGDASIKIYPLPRVPVTMILWVEDDEFPPRVDLFFDSTCDMQIDLSDIIWSTAMTSALVMLEE